VHSTLLVGPAECRPEGHFSLYVIIVIALVSWRECGPYPVNMGKLGFARSDRYDVPGRDRRAWSW
jgi:hypothetical protein